jgi:heme-degrading monooxygenase HmoA
MRVLPDLRRIAGFSGAYLFEREQDGEVGVLVMTLWDSLDAVRAFAGTDIDAAVVEAEARAVLARYDPMVSHHTVVVDTVSGQGGS